MLGDMGNKQVVRILLECILVTGHNEAVAKVMFLLVSVILSTGGCLPQCMLGYHPLGADIPQSRHPPEQTPPWEQTPPPGADTPGTDTPQSRHHPLRSRHPSEQRDPPGADTSWEQTAPQADTPPESRLQHTVNKRPVRILLECILVEVYIYSGNA